MNLPASWGLKCGEKELAFPCDEVPFDRDGVYFRGITIHAESGLVFQWLLQLRRAPYSYDWINNLGRQSPRKLVNINPVSHGQTMMYIFNVVGFEKNRSLTLRVKQPSFWHFLFGDILLSYLILIEETGNVRLLVKICRRFNRNLLGRFMKHFLPWANLIMHRKQLLLFKSLCERQVG